MAIWLIQIVPQKIETAIACLINRFFDWEVNDMNGLKAWVRKNKIVTALLIFLMVGGVIYFLASRLIFEAIYNGTAPVFLSKLLPGKSEHSINFYLKKLDNFWLRSNIIFACFILSFSWAARLIEQKVNILDMIEAEFIQIKKAIHENRKALLLSLTLSLFFYSLYFVLGRALISNYAPNKFTFFFADSYKWVDLNWSKYHKGSHPLMLLIVELFGFLRAFFPFVPKITLAVILNSFFGASAVFWAALFFWNYTKKYLETFLATTAFGLTMTQLFFSVLLESYALSAGSIIATYVLLIICLRHQKTYWGYWILAGLFSFGVTITNFAQTLICFTALLLFLKKDNRLVTILEYIGTVISLAFLLSLLQHKLFGGEYFFVPSAANREIVWIRTTIFNHPLLIIQEIIKHFFLVNFVSPSPFPADIIPGEKIILSFFGRPLNYSIFGLTGTFIWLFILSNGIYQDIISFQQDNDRFFQFLLIPIILAILGNMAFYSIFNAEEMFIFTCHFTFLVLVLAANRLLLSKRYFQIAMALSIVFMGLNNLTILRQIITT